VTDPYELLRNARTIAVVGLNSDPSRPSHGVARYLKAQGYKIIPVNPNETEVFGERAYASLRDVPEKIDLVDVFRRPEFTPEVVREAIEVGAGAVWLQLGIANPESRALAEAAGLPYIEDRCTQVDHAVGGIGRVT
jgi:predicted CoA-binding protein